MTHSLGTTPACTTTWGLYSRTGYLAGKDLHGDQRAGRKLDSDDSTRLDCRVGPNGLGPDLLDDGLLDAGGWSVVVPRPGLRLYSPSMGKCPAESRYVNLVPLQRITG
jgi:hypothetical protein